MLSYKSNAATTTVIQYLSPALVLIFVSLKIKNYLQL